MTLGRLREPRGGGPNSELPTLPSLGSDSTLVPTERVPLSEAQWHLLRVHSVVHKYGSDETILSEGESNDSLLVVLEGRALQIVEPNIQRRASETPVSLLSSSIYILWHSQYTAQSQYYSLYFRCLLQSWMLVLIQRVDQHLRRLQTLKSLVLQPPLPKVRPKIVTLFLDFDQALSSILLRLCLALEVVR